jgi:hypothetical protein
MFKNIVKIFEVCQKPIVTANTTARKSQRPSFEMNKIDLLGRKAEDEGKGCHCRARNLPA